MTTLPVQEFANDNFRTQHWVTKSRKRNNVDNTYNYVWYFSVGYDCSMDHGDGFATKAEATQAAFVAHTNLVFNTQVRQYTGPLDLSDVEAPCVDCGKSVKYDGIDIGGRETCPASTRNGGSRWGHRVQGDGYKAWQRMVKIAEAKAALAGQDA